MNRAALPAMSPCIGICRLHAHARVCIGCGRTGDEIAEWRDADEGQRHALLAALPARLSEIDMVPTPSAETPDAVGAVVRDALRYAGTSVMVGCHGAMAVFMAPPDEIPSIEYTGTALQASVTGGAFRLESADGLTLFRADGLTLFRADGGDNGARACVLLAARSAGRSLPIAEGVARLGGDPDPIAASGVDRSARPIAFGSAQAGGAAPPRENAVLFDLGLGHPHARILVRLTEPAHIAHLSALQGAPIERALAEAGQTLSEARPDWVVETPQCRVEIATAILAPGGQTPLSPHMRLQPGALALGRFLPPGITCPAGFVPVALVHVGSPSH